ncbi:hypothetical protein [Furfurilactobacillus rossiae]|uniref:Uncharacterized protein n=1 Tax=Furfurilactobacillus rossiae DSM 15814 TaxID=1114972 RepID=A0A0R1RHC8_9LACO|nr:hypothetical protein [Furfurilactobacillus rossiae]KRL53637.1 hypothetical protein FD35_GL001002 [Furfurilactobacillus rossiae DSM 15814]MCF6166124.1 hypothetical protein [Furfurilactobacillus rossiae]QFR67501.1 hypothetical protein LR814_10475 [Furfurilactobacillus rossiae]
MALVSEDRYYQPKDSKDAMRYIERLFNRYKDAPITQELVDYNHNLTAALRSDIAQAALAENAPQRHDAAINMADEMDKWARTRAAGQPFHGQLKHFKFVGEAATPRFKAHTVKNHQRGNLRASRH